MRFLGLKDDYETTPDGVVFENVVPAKEQAEKWLDWAHRTAVDLKASWSDNSANTRYNLGQFWALKNEHYQEDPSAWDELDVMAHKIWASLAEMGMVKDNPPAQPRYQQEAQQAYAGMKAAMQRTGRDTGAADLNAQASSDWYQVAVKMGVDDSLSAAVIKRTDELLETANSLFDIPLWIWGAGALGALWVLYGRK